LLKYLIEDCGVHLDENGDKLFYNACFGGHIEIVKYLKEKCGVDINKSHGDIWDFNTREYLLWVAVKSNSLKTVKFLVENGADINNGKYEKSKKISPLWLACKAKKKRNSLVLE